jgi:hypothetical protein
MWYTMESSHFTEQRIKRMSNRGAYLNLHPTLAEKY